MKRSKLLLPLVFLVSLSACSSNVKLEELSISGIYMSNYDIANYISNYNNYMLNYSSEKKSQWYSVDIKIYSKETNSNVTYEREGEYSGSIYVSRDEFYNKAKIDAKIISTKYDINTYETTTVKSKGTITFYEGFAYMYSKYEEKTENEKYVESTYEKEDLSFNEAISILGIPSLEICDYFDMMQNPLGLYNVNTYSIGTNNGIAITQSYDGNLSQIYFDTLEDSYQMKELKIYSSTYSYDSDTNKSVETKYAISIKTKLFGLITKTSNLNKY